MSILLDPQDLDAPVLLVNTNHMSDIMNTPAQDIFHGLDGSTTVISNRRSS